MKSLKIAVLTLALLASGSVLADVQKSVHIIADVAPTLDLVKGDGTPLPGGNAFFPMTHAQGVGLQPLAIPVKILTNDIAKDVFMRLEGSPTLSVAGAASGSGVPLTVRFKDSELISPPVRFTPAALGFSANPAGSIWVGESQVWDLVISQTTPGTLPRGSYLGEVRVVVAQAT